MANVAEKWAYGLLLDRLVIVMTMQCVKASSLLLSVICLIDEASQITRLLNWPSSSIFKGGIIHDEGTLHLDTNHPSTMKN
jgi:hypothetical protein